MSTTLTLEPVPSFKSWWIKEGATYRGILFPPAAPGDAWEVWIRGEWIAHRFESEAAALADLGILTDMEMAA